MIRYLTIGLLAACLAACGDDHAHSGDPACYYATLGAMTVIPTTDMGTEPTAEVHFMEHGHKVQLGAGETGYVWINVPETGDAGIYIQSTGAIEAFYHEGTETALEEPTVHPECGDIFPVYYDVPDMAAGTWHIKLSQAAEASEVWIMAIPTKASNSHSEHDHHHHH